MEDQGDPLVHVRAELAKAADRLSKDQDSLHEPMRLEAVIAAVAETNALIAMKGALAFLNPQLDDPKAALSMWASGGTTADAIQFLRHLSGTHHLPVFMEAGIKLHRPTQNEEC